VLRINVERKFSRAPVDLYYYFGLEHSVAGEISPSMLPSTTQNYFSVTGSTPSTNDFLLSVFDSKTITSHTLPLALKLFIRFEKIKYELRRGLSP